MKNNLKNYFILLLPLLFSLLLCSDDKDVVPDYTFKGTNYLIKGNESLKITKNESLVLSEYISSGPTLISFWFLTCVPCKKEMSFLDEYNKKYRDTGFQVLSINTDPKRAAKGVKNYIKDKKYSFDIVSDLNGKYLKRVGASACPFTILVDENGNIFWDHLGFELGEEEILEQKIVELIEFNNQSKSNLKNSIEPLEK